MDGARRRLVGIWESWERGLGVFATFMSGIDDGAQADDGDGFDDNIKEGDRRDCDGRRYDDCANLL